MKNVNARPTEAEPSAKGHVHLNEIHAAIRAIMAIHPDLSSYGWRFNNSSGWNCGENFQKYRAEMLSEVFAHQVMTCLEAIHTKAAPGYAWRIARRRSYGLKHAVEAWVRRTERKDLEPYITNGAFITAAIIDGWLPVRDINRPNCGFRRGQAFPRRGQDVAALEARLAVEAWLAYHGKGSTRAVSKINKCAVPEFADLVGITGGGK